APNYFYVHINKGIVLQSLGELQVAVSHYDEASKCYAQAIAAYDEALCITPDDIYAHNNKGNALASLGNLQDWLSRHDEAMRSYNWAVEAYSRSLEIAPAQEIIRKLRDSIQQILDKQRIL